MSPASRLTRWICAGTRAWWRWRAGIGLPCVAHSRPAQPRGQERAPAPSLSDTDAATYRIQTGGLRHSGAAGARLGSGTAVTQAGSDAEGRRIIIRTLCFRQAAGAQPPVPRPSVGRPLVGAGLPHRLPASRARPHSARCTARQRTAAGITTERAAQRSPRHRPAHGIVQRSTRPVSSASRHQLPACLPDADLPVRWGKTNSSTQLGLPAQPGELMPRPRERGHGNACPLRPAPALCLPGLMVCRRAWRAWRAWPSGVHGLLRACWSRCGPCVGGGRDSTRSLEAGREKGGCLAP